MIETGFYIASSAYTPTPELGNEYYTIIFVPSSGE